MKLRTTVAIVLLCVGIMAQVCGASSAESAARENAELRSRVESLEAQLKEIKSLLEKQPSPASPVGAQLSEEELSKIATMVRQSPSGKSPVLSSLDMELYGYIKLDGSYDTSKGDPGNYIKWLENESSYKDGDEFNATANQTRLGVKIRGPRQDGLEVSGNVEVDFYGNGSGENKAGLMMRHAYMQLDWPEERFSILGGQTSDLISPLNPSTLSYSVQWWSGNIGYRRPQLRLTKGFALCDDVDVTLAGAIARTIGDSKYMGTTVIDEDHGKPVFQARAGVSFPSPLGYKRTALGVSGHWGEEEYDLGGGLNGDVETWSVNLDVVQPINEWLSISGELWAGENLDAFLGGVGQGINTAGQGIRSKGGWVAASLSPWDKWAFNFGVGIDNPNRSDVDADGRTYNRSIFGNVLYSLNKNTQIGFELTRWDTKYKGEGDADSLRAQMSLIYKF